MQCSSLRLVQVRRRVARHAGGIAASSAVHSGRGGVCRVRCRQWYVLGLDHGAVCVCVCIVCSRIGAWSGVYVCACCGERRRIVGEHGERRGNNVLTPCNVALEEGALDEKKNAIGGWVDEYIQEQDAVSPLDAAHSPLEATGALFADHHTLAHHQMAPCRGNRS